MDSQISLNGFDNLTEESVYSGIHPALADVLSKNHIDENCLSIKRGKVASSVWLDTLLIFSICIREDKRYITVDKKYHPRIPDGIAAEIDISVNPIKIPAHFLNDETLVDFIRYVLDSEIDLIPKKFSCCSYYTECSDAKKCVHPDRRFAMGCGYKKIMKHGRIFYGKNRNVD